MQPIKPEFLGLFLWTWGCVGLPITDLDASTTGGAASTSDTTSVGGGTGTGGATSMGGTQTSTSTGNGDSSSACSETFTACGGDPTGTWDIISVCMQGDLAAAANVNYAADSVACSSLCTGATLAAHGSVAYSAGSIQPNAVLSLSETLEMTASCYAALFGGAWNSASCAAVAQMLEKQSGTTAACSAGKSVCDCVYMATTPASADTYTVNGSTLVASDGSTTEFCVQGSTMTQRDSLGNNAYAVTQYSKR